jgi:Calcineurin-like phosphoesterase
MAVFLTGDTHKTDIPTRFNHDNLKKLNHTFNESEDYMIVVGDFGLLWTVYDRTEEWIVKYLHEKPFITLFVDGNHENFERINRLPEIEMFGGKVGKYSDSIFHLKRGEAYAINEKSIFVMGGGVSIDREMRKDRVTWWAEEMPNFMEYKHAMETLEEYNYKFDYILTHTAPDKIRDVLLRSVGLMVRQLNAYGEEELVPYKEKDQLSEFFQMLIDEKNLDFKTWYFGHYHVDARVTDDDDGATVFRCLYEDIERME